MENKKTKSGVIVGVIVSLVIVVILGVTFAIWTYSNTLQNQVLISGDIFMRYTESNELTITGALPKTEPGVDDYFQFTIEGRNKYSKPIWYEIVLNWEEEPTGQENTERTERIKDNLLMFRLVETKDGVDKTVLDNTTYNNLKDGKAIWVNTINANTDNVKITYKLYMWISPKTNIGNTSLADYDMDTWNSVFASIKVSVNGDFNEKEVKKEIQYGIGTEAIKSIVVDNVTDTCDDFTEKGGLVAINTEGKLYQGSEGEEIREYRYVGSDVDNYIYFNCEDNKVPSASTCEIWRILGIFKDEDGNEHLKIVNNKVLTRDMFPATFEANNTTYNIQSTSSGDYAYWNKKTSGTNNNDWATAGLQYWLNAGIDKDTKEPNDGYMSYLSKNAKDMIAKTKYYLGNVKYGDTAISSYTHERGDTTCSGSCSGGDVWEGNQATWNGDENEKGNIALMYPSDYGYTANSCNWTKATNSSSTMSSSWLQQTANHSSSEWLLAPSSSHSNYAAYWGTSGYVSGYYVDDNNYGVRASLNLKSQARIDAGGGSVTSPFVANLGD